MVIALVDDLLFSSKIRGVADRTGAQVMFVRAADALVSEARDKKPRTIIVDLDRAALKPLDAIRQIKGADDLRAIQIVGFVSHVHGELIRQAREAGADLVLARSAFVTRLPELVAGITDGSAGSA